jgi:hypothetical protein
MGHFVEKPQFPSEFALICIGTLQWKEYDPICVIHLIVVKLQYLPYFQNNFQMDYTGESGIERV